ncbi:hypothetical protein [Streptomyces griseorubiginosus]|uniref:hypothetical protein n=1 Tax=Streptomyces griseorubiginosus TaxID=67304 RepID=UPI0015E848D0
MPPSQPVGGPGDGRTCAGVVAHVGADPGGRAARGGGIEVEHGDTRSTLGQLLRDGPSDT